MSPHHWKNNLCRYSAVVFCDRVPVPVGVLDNKGVSGRVGEDVSLNLCSMATLM